DVDTLGIDPHDLARLYRHSWLRQQTFEQALVEEIRERRARLESLNPEMPELLARARAVESHWEHETQRLTELQEQGQRQIAETNEAIERRDARLLDAYDGMYDADPDAARPDLRPVEDERERLERSLARLSERDVTITQRLADIREESYRLGSLLGDLRDAA